MGGRANLTPPQQPYSWRGGVLWSLQKFCQQSVVMIWSDKNIRQACQLLRTHNIGRIIAAEEGKLSGILTDRDIAPM